MQRIWQQLNLDINWAKCAMTKYLLEVFGLLSFVFQDVPPLCEMLSPRPRRLTWNTKKVSSLAGRYVHSCTHSHRKHKHRVRVSMCANTQLERLPVSARTHGSTCTHLDFSGCCCVSSASVRASASSPCSTCGAIISWHTYPPLNDFSSSSASHLIKVESLMPFRDPTAFNCIHCHYENEWRQLRTQMFFHILTECLLMCLVIFTVAAFDWRPWLGTRLITLHISYITLGLCSCSVSPFLTCSLSHKHVCCSLTSLVYTEKSSDRRK